MARILRVEMQDIMGGIATSVPRPASALARLHRIRRACEQRADREYEVAMTRFFRECSEAIAYCNEGHRHRLGLNIGLSHIAMKGIGACLIYTQVRMSLDVGASFHAQQRAFFGGTPWLGPPRFSSRSASASRSTATCRPSSDRKILIGQIV
jgi:hypothetical protein